MNINNPSSTPRYGAEPGFWRTEVRTMGYGGWTSWAHHRSHRTEEARDEALASLEGSRDVLYGWIEFRAAAMPEVESDE